MDWKALIDPEFAQATAGGGPSIGDLRIEDLPSLYEERRAAGSPVLSGRVQRDDAMVTADPDVTVRIHRPHGLVGPAPCLVTIHGGSFVAGSNRMDDVLLDDWCPVLGCVGVSIDYRLAPECPYPGPLDDCYNALSWIHAHHESLGIHAARIGIYGVSAGGALAAGLALRARDQRQPEIACLVLEGPTLDDRQLTESSYWHVPVADRATIKLGWRAYLGPLYGSDHIPSYAAPGRASDLARFPPTLISVGAVDGLHDECVDFANKLRSNGVDAELDVYAGAPHTFCSINPQSNITLRCRRHQLHWLNRHL